VIGVFPTPIFATRPAIDMNGDIEPRVLSFLDFRPNWPDMSVMEILIECRFSSRIPASYVFNFYLPARASFSHSRVCGPRLLMATVALAVFFKEKVPRFLRTIPHFGPMFS